MVSMLYRTHKSLQPQFKVPSLYAFDALARAARSHALKHGFTGDAQTGNSATFLLKLEAILEGLFQDVVGSGVSEVKVSRNHVVADLPIYTSGESLVLVVPLSQDTG
jgi:protein NRD1